MSIENHVTVDTVYTRSINLERDVDSTSIIAGYIPTTRALLTLRRIEETLGDHNTPRSWALIGPYGSGKSSFAVFLTHLLYSGNEQVTEIALQSIYDHDENLSGVFADYILSSNGFASILLTGAPEPLIPRFLSSLQDAAQSFWETIPGPKPSIVAKIDYAIGQKKYTNKDVLQLVADLRLAVEKAHGKGLLIMFDELGKFLEYEARHYGANDIYLLQELAEMAVTGHDANMYIFTLMHQGFDQYARGLGEELRNEWSKIQGRFENIPFLESTEQTLRIVSKAFENNAEQEDLDKIQVECNTIAKKLNKTNALPGSLDVKTASTIFSDCYPLHPVTLLLLPILCQKMAQNERTLFSYLGSKEQHGFRHSLTTLNRVGDWIMPSEIFDYFILNQSAVLTDPTTHRRWAEVVTAIERLGDAPPKQLNLLKTIGLLNIVGAQGGFRASKDIISLCMTSKKATTMTATGLIERAVVQFRKFSNEYRVWQGSDFDLEDAVQNELGQLGRNFDLPAAINERKSLQPIVARRHTITTGALRYFTPSFVDINSVRNIPAESDQQRLILCLVESAEDVPKVDIEVTSYFSDRDIIAICPNGAQLREAVGEVLALHRVEQNCPELNSDPVANREFKDRFASAELLEDDLLTSLLELPEESEWYWQGKQQIISCKRDLQQQLSHILDHVYCDTPYIFNELINREKPSAQATAARNKLVAALVHNVDKPELGIEKFPPEKAIYLAFLKATGLHQQDNDGTWKLHAPTKDNEFNLYPVWSAIDSFLDNTQDTPKSFVEITAKLQAPPFGVKKGVLPLLYLTVFLANQHELALYEDNVYTPYITNQHIDRFMKRPDFFTVQRLKIHGIRASLFQQYVGVLYGEDNKQEASLHAIAKPLAKFMVNLEDFTQQTNRLSTHSQKARKAVELAKSPADLLFTKLPTACGFSAINPDETDDKKIEGFASALVDVIRELRDCYKNMIIEFQSLLSQALLPDVKKELGLSELRQKLRATYEDLGQYTIDTKGLCPFVEHLAEPKANDKLWFNRLLLFLGGRASDKWLDVDRDNGVKKLQDLSRRLIDLKYLQSSYQKQRVKTGDNLDVIWLRTMRHGTKSDCDKVVRVSSSAKEHVKSSKKEFANLLSGLGDDNTRLAMLAELVDDLLNSKNKIEYIERPEKEGKIINESK